MILAHGSQATGLSNSVLKQYCLAIRLECDAVLSLCACVSVCVSVCECVCVCVCVCACVLVTDCRNSYRFFYMDTLAAAGQQAMRT